MEASFKVSRSGKPSIKAAVDFSTGQLVTHLTLPIEASPELLADIATVLSGDCPVQVVLSNPQHKLDELFQNTPPGSNK